MPKRKKERLKDRLWKKFSKGLIETAEHLPSAKKGVLSWLQNVRRERVLFKNDKPNYIEVELSSIWVCFITPIEDFQAEFKAVGQILNEYRTKRFLSFNLDRNKDLLEKLSKIKEGIYGGSWYNIGLLDFIDSPLKSYIDTAHFEIQVFDGSFVSLVFRITPSESFLRNVNSIVSRNVSESLEIYPPRNFKSLFRGWWGGKSQNESHYKLQLIQREVQKLKEAFTGEVRDFFTGYFLERDDLIPSIELWTYKQTFSPIDKNLRTHERMFWDSLGMNSSWLNRFSTKNQLQTIFWPDKEQNDSSIKYLVNIDHRKVSSGYLSVEHEVESSTNYWAPTLLSAWAFRLLILDLNDSFVNLRINLYELLKRKIFNNPLKYAESFLKSKTLLNRISSIFQKESIQRRFIHSGFPEFKNEGKRKETFLQLLEGNVEFLKKESFSLMKENQEILEATVNAKVIRTNLKVQDYILFLTILTTAIMIYDKRTDIANFSCKQGSYCAESSKEKKKKQAEECNQNSEKSNVDLFKADKKLIDADPRKANQIINNKKNKIK